MKVTSILFGALLVAAPVARLAAQDVSFSPLAWVHSDDPPDRFPAPRNTSLPEFPEDLVKTTDFGFVSVEAFVDERGAILSWESYGTLPVFERELELMHVPDKGSYKNYGPAQRAGKPVNSLIHFSVLFNPSSAHSIGPDATPRLLDAWPVVDPDRDSSKEDPTNPEATLRATVSIDENGRPTGVKGVPARMSGLLEQSLSRWRFAPARRGGHAVKQEVQVPFVIIAGHDDSAKSKVPPRVIKQFPPKFPEALNRSGLRGHVLVEFVVDIEGRVTEPFVVKSLNPAFDAPAIEAVRQWTFEPGRKAGVPIEMKMAVPIYFSLNGADEGGDDDIEVRQRIGPSRLPEEWQVDIPPKVLSIVLPVYPYEMFRDDVSGSSEVAYGINAQGRVAASQITKADRPEFGLALQAAIERFEYEPAIKDGRPHKAVMKFSDSFDTSDPRFLTDSDVRILRLERKHPEKIGSEKDLDGPIKVVAKRSPIFPRSLLGKVARGDALVGLIIDEDGHPHLERLLSASEPAFGYSAVQAAALWLFEPPMIKGKAAMVKVQLPFAFPTSSDAAHPKQP